MTSPPGMLVISLDFELYWGVRDKRRLEDYAANLLGVRQAIPLMLDAFAQAGVHATWATVGFLFFDDKDELIANLPAELPAYANAALSPYPALAGIGPDERRDPYHYARSLLLQIKGAPHQEIGTHTFSHYYCLETGQTEAQFGADLAAARGAAKLLDLELTSLVFPRNQFNPTYLDICRTAGLGAYRGNQAGWMYSAGSDGEESRFKRAGRLADAYLPLSGANGHRIDADARPVNVPASRFLRPVASRSRGLDGLRLARIKAEMTSAARRGLAYHLWWHPHNFGADPEANLAQLGELLAHFRGLEDQYGMVSRNMGELAAPQARLRAA